MSHSITITLADSIMLRNVDGKPINLDTTKLTADVIARIFEGGVKVMTTNAFNSGGKDRSEGDRLAQLEKRLAAWYRGEYAIAERGDTWMTQLRDHFTNEQVGAGRTVKQVDKDMADLVHAVYGEKEKVTFSRYLDAVATCLAKEDGAGEYADIREAIESDIAERMQAANELRAKSREKLDTKAINLAAFRK